MKKLRNHGYGGYQIWPDDQSYGLIDDACKYGSGIEYAASGCGRVNYL